MRQKDLYRLYERIGIEAYSYENIKKFLEQETKNDQKKLMNLKMACNHYKNLESIGAFNIATISIVFAAGTYFLSVNQVRLALSGLVILILMVVALINKNKKARKILDLAFVLEHIEVEE